MRLVPAHPPSHPRWGGPAHCIQPITGGGAVTTHVLGAPQGLSSNIYDLNLENRSITGLASLTNGAGLFMGLDVRNGLVRDGKGHADASGHIKSAVMAYNEGSGPLLNGFRECQTYRDAK